MKKKKMILIEHTETGSTYREVKPRNIAKIKREMKNRKEDDDDFNK